MKQDDEIERLKRVLAEERRARLRMVDWALHHRARLAGRQGNMPVREAENMINDILLNITWPEPKHPTE